jgi:hypothetical protein
MTKRASNEPRHMQLNVRVSADEVAYLRRNAANYGAAIGRPFSVGQYVRMKLFDCDLHTDPKRKK